MFEFTGLDPVVEFDEEHSLVTPAIRSKLLRDMVGIDTCVMVCFPDLENDEASKDLDPLYRFVAGGATVMQYVYQDSILVANMAGGAPSAARLMEELISLGIDRFVLFGSAGLICPEFPQDHVLLVTEALRDEGTSYHYISASKVCMTTPLLRAQVKGILENLGIAFTEGKIWTTDAMYRETPSRVARRFQQGALAVDMESSALCAIAQRRGVEFAHIAYIANSLVSDVWSGFYASYGNLRRRALKHGLEIGMEVAKLL